MVRCKRRCSGHRRVSWSSAFPVIGCIPSAQARELVDELREIQRKVEYQHIEASFGHDSFLVEVETMTQIVGGYLNRLWKERANHHSV